MRYYGGKQQVLSYPVQKKVRRKVTMKINPIQAYKSVQQSSLARSNNIRGKEDTTIQKSDQVTISDEARLFSAALKAAKEAGDVRAEKILQLQAKIRNGSYHMQASDVADRIIKGAVSYDEHGRKRP
jgi:negative regulator of flagellin synthesis FlgM